jgi:hypothetical protein
MKETAEMLMKHTRSELLEMAEKLGINTVGVAKMNIADSIVKARMTAEKPAAKEASKQKTKASKAEVPHKAQVKPHVGMNIGKKGVFAKRAAISAQMGANAEAAAAIGTGVMEMQKSIEDMTSGMNKFAKKVQQDGAAKLQKGVDEMQKSINAQTKLNEKAAAKMETGIKEMHSGVKVIQKGINQMETIFGEYRNETANYIKDFYYG